MPIDEGTIKGGILKGLTLGANFFVQKMKERLDGGNYPKGDPDRDTTSIQEATSIDTAKESGDHAYIDVVIDLKKAPFAGAFEYGSGEKGPAGQRYRIEPKNASVLAIPRERWPNYEPPPDVDPVFLSYVLHPGIAPKPYIKPTIRENKKEIARLIGKEFVAEIRRGMKVIEIIE